MNDRDVTIAAIRADTWTRAQEALRPAARIAAMHAAVAVENELARQTNGAMDARDYERHREDVLTTAEMLEAWLMRPVDGATP